MSVSSELTVTKFPSAASFRNNISVCVALTLEHPVTVCFQGKTEHLDKQIIVVLIFEEVLLVSNNLEFIFYLYVRRGMSHPSLTFMVFYGWACLTIKNDAC